jgi:hypothetical protein
MLETQLLTIGYQGQPPNTATTDVANRQGYRVRRVGITGESCIWSQSFKDRSFVDKVTLMFDHCEWSVGCWLEEWQGSAVSC